MIILSVNLKFVQNKDLKSFTFNFRGSDKSALILWDDVDFTTFNEWFTSDLNLQLDWSKDEVQQLRTTVVMQIFSYLCAFLTNYADLVYSTKNFREEDPCQQKTWKDKKKRIIVSSEFYAWNCQFWPYVHWGSQPFCSRISIFWTNLFFANF